MSMADGNVSQWGRHEGAVGTDVEAAIGSAGAITEPEQLRTYECDGLTTKPWSTATSKHRPSAAKRRLGARYRYASSSRRPDSLERTIESHTSAAR